MTVWLAIPVLGGLLMLQLAVISNIQLLHGSADLVLLAIIAWSLQRRVTSAWQWSVVGGLMVSFVSALPYGIPLIGYLLVTGIVMVSRRRVWQYPVLIMIIVTFVGTFIVQVIAFFSLRFSGVSLPFTQSFNLIILPSMILNLLFALPIYAVIGELANWLYPEEMEV